jgi:1,4-dihydroxy-2-naphthoate polyprenyltransferase
MSFEANSLKIWLQAARLRTLPLSFSGIIAGAALALSEGVFNIYIGVLSLWCTLLFQVISNFANDYGDGLKGTDNDQRIGPKRVLQSGLLAASQLKRGIVFLSVVAVFSVLLLLTVSFGISNWPYFLLFFVLGIASIWSAIRYTVGASAFGYKGLGDLFVFLFFGLLSVLGSKFLYNLHISLSDIFPALVIGSLSVSVLNLNNLRDHENDRLSDKNTLVVKLGYKWGKRYHMLLFFLAFLASLGTAYFSFESSLNLLPLLVFIPLLFHLIKVSKTTLPSLLDPELKKVALLTFLWSICFLIGSNYLL